MLEEWSVDNHVYQELVDAVQEWQRRSASDDRPFLYYSKIMQYVTVYDGRNPQMPTRQRYDWPEAGIIKICDEAAKSRDQIRDALQTSGRGPAVSDDHLAAALAQLTSRCILYEERDKFFTLAIPEHQHL